MPRKTTTNELVIDTRNASRPKPFAITVDDGTPEGKRLEFTIKPLTADSYLDIIAYQKQLSNLGKPGASREEIKEGRAAVDAIIRPLIEPADIFTEWADSVSEFDYCVAMDRIAGYAMPKNALD